MFKERIGLNLWGSSGINNLIIRKNSIFVFSSSYVINKKDVNQNIYTPKGICRKNLADEALSTLIMKIHS